MDLLKFKLTVAYDGTVVIYALVDRREELTPLTPGGHRLGWAFQHVLKGWMHEIRLSVDGESTLLESRSEANKDKPYSVGIALLKMP